MTARNRRRGMAHTTIVFGSPLSTCPGSTSALRPRLRRCGRPRPVTSSKRPNSKTSTNGRRQFHAEEIADEHGVKCCCSGERTGGGQRPDGPGGRGHRGGAGRRGKTRQGVSNGK